MANADENPTKGTVDLIWFPKPLCYQRKEEFDESEPLRYMHHGLPGDTYMDGDVVGACKGYIIGLRSSGFWTSFIAKTNDREPFVIKSIEQLDAVRKYQFWIGYEHANSRVTYVKTDTSDWFAYSGNSHYPENNPALIHMEPYFQTYLNRLVQEEEFQSWFEKEYVSIQWDLEREYQRVDGLLPNFFDRHELDPDLQSGWDRDASEPGVRMHKRMKSGFRP